MTAIEETAAKTPPETSPAPAKRPYVRPTLVSYGSVAKLTRNDIGSGVEGASGMTGMN